MPWARCSRFHTLTAILVLAALPAAAPADEDDEEDSVDAELTELKEDDFPDLVGADEVGELMDEFALLEEASTVESAARHVQDIGMSPSAVTVITRQDIETSGATTIPDLLRMVPGMDVVLVSPFYMAITARLYWTHENNHFLVLIDGREANLEMIGQTAWEIQPISLQDIERIEIIRGPASSLYGPNAVAGVITITTRGVPEATSAWAQLAGGDTGNLTAGARASTRVGAWGFSANAEFNRFGTFGDPRTEGKRAWKIRSLAEYRFSSVKRLRLEVGASRGEGPLTTPIGSIQGVIDTRTVRLAYDSEDVRAQLYWANSPTRLDWTTPLGYGGVLLANFVPSTIRGDSFDGQVQWNLPTFYEPLLLIAGAGARATWMRSDEQLDARTYADITSARYHQVGVDHVEVRTGAFVHGELSPVDWVTLTTGLRFDYNNDTSAFWSPRLAAVFQPADGHYLRVGAARAFRKPAYLELNGHLAVDFPPGSPIQGTAKERFLEFMTRVNGNLELDNEKLWSFEAGYLGRFLDGRLSVALDLYFNYHTDVATLDPRIVTDARGLPDLELSSMVFENQIDVSIWGSELSVRYLPTPSLTLMASWTHRETLFGADTTSMDESPKNLITLGARLHTERGLLGSLYLFSRSEFLDRSVENPRGLLDPLLEQHLENVLLVLARLGWQWATPDGLRMEAGMKLFLPLSPFRAPHFRFREKGGGVTATGQAYGGLELARVMTAYLQASY